MKQVAEAERLTSTRPTENNKVKSTLQKEETPRLCTSLQGAREELGEETRSPQADGKEPGLGSSKSELGVGWWLLLVLLLLLVLTNLFHTSCFFFLSPFLWLRLFLLPLLLGFFV